MEDRCVIDYHRLEELKNLLDDYYGIKLSRTYVKAVFNGAEVVEEIRTYGVGDPIVLANAQLILAKRLNVGLNELSGELLEAENEDFQS